MAFTHGKAAVFKVDNSGGALQDITAYTTKVDMPHTADTAETSVFGSTSKTFVAGLKGATISVEGTFDPTLDNIMYGIIGLSGSFEYGPQGSTGGLVKYYGEAICTNYSPPADMTSANKWTATFTVTGAVSRTTW